MGSGSKPENINFFQKFFLLKINIKFIIKLYIISSLVTESCLKTSKKKSAKKAPSSRSLPRNTSLGLRIEEGGFTVHC